MTYHTKLAQHLLSSKYKHNNTNHPNNSKLALYVYILLKALPQVYVKYSNEGMSRDNYSIRWSNKTVFAQISISVLCMHYIVSKDDFTLFGVHSILELSKYSKVHITGLFLTMPLFLVRWKIFWTFLKKWFGQNRTSRTSSTALVHKYFMWSDQRDKMCFIFHKVVRVLYGKLGS